MNPEKNPETGISDQLEFLLGKASNDCKKSIYLAIVDKCNPSPKLMSQCTQTNKYTHSVNSNIFMVQKRISSSSSMSTFNSEPTSRICKNCSKPFSKSHVYICSSPRKLSLHQEFFRIKITLIKLALQYTLAQLLCCCS